MTYMCLNMEKVYCDTCVYRDYYEWRPGKYWLHFGQEAKGLFDRIELGAFILIISDHLEYQLKEFPKYKEYVDKLRTKGLIIEIKVTLFEKNKANQHIINNPNSEYEDALHAELAIKAGADFFVTRNIEHYQSYGNKLKICFPENIGAF